MKSLFKYAYRMISILFFLNVMMGCDQNREESISHKHSNSVEVSVKPMDEKPFLKKYAIKSAKIEYEVRGSMDIMGSKSQTMGKKTLLFTHYGSHELSEEEKVEKKEFGAKKEVIKTHTLTYNKDATVYKSDFEKNSTIRMSMPAVTMMFGLSEDNPIEIGETMMTSLGGKKVGTQKILGYECDNWSLMGTVQCLYKGIPLKIESNIMGVKNMTVATKAQFDVTVKKSDFTLPNFPIMNAITGEELSKNELEGMDQAAKEKALKNQEKVANLKEVVKTVETKMESNMSTKEEAQMVMETISTSKGMQSEFEKQKSMMSQMVQMMKSYKACLIDAHSKTDAKGCAQEVDALAQKIGLNDDVPEEEEDTRTWTKEGRAAVIEEIENDLKTLERRLPCIEKATNMMELMQCHQ